MVGKERRLSELVTALDRGVTDAEQLPRLAALLLGQLRACSLSISSAFAFDGWRYDHAISPDWATFYNERRGTDPGQYRILGAPPGQFYLVRHDSVGQERELEIFHGLPRYGFSDVAAARFYSPFTDDLFLVVYRPKGEAAFDEHDRALMQLLYPHLSAALATKRALASLGAPSSVTGALEGSVHLHVSFPGPRVHMTRGARQLFEQVLGPLSAQGLRRVERMIASAATTFFRAHVGGRSIRLIGGIRAEMAAVEPEGKEHRRLLVLLHREKDVMRTHPSPVEELLSGLERRIARRAARGLSAKEIAAACGLTEATTRWYMKAIYEKLGVHNRTELAFALGLPLIR
jgi:DNA-binding CsgD family transcriptional regulator